MTRLLILLTALGLVACSDMGQRIYENTNRIRDAKRTPGERAIAPTPSYKEYKQEREGTPQE